MCGPAPPPTGLAIGDDISCLSQDEGILPSSILVILAGQFQFNLLFIK